MLRSVRLPVFRRSAICAALALAAMPLLGGSASARDERQGAPGKFDFYVLALSWSPSYCEAQGARAPRQQCGERPYSFVVHGLWPQYERGFPEYCKVPAPRLDRGTVSKMLDIMPSPRLVFHQWDKHGTCSGLSARAYFENVRKAYAVVKIPPQFLNLQQPLTVSPGEVEEAFIKANPGLPREAIAITCDNRLREVRICMSRELTFRPCEEIDRRSCRRERVVMPPVRGRAPRVEAPSAEPTAAAVAASQPAQQKNP